MLRCDINVNLFKMYNVTFIYSHTDNHERALEALSTYGVDEVVQK